MVDQDRSVDLGRLYALFLKVPNDAGKDALRFAMRSDIEDRGKAINDAANEPEPGPSTGGDQPGMDVDGDIKGKGKAKPTSPQSAALSSALRWVQDVLDLKDKFDRILDGSFGGDKAVQSSINLVRALSFPTTRTGHQTDILILQAFQTLINANSRAPEFLSLYIDEHLKKGAKSVSGLSDWSSGVTRY